MSTYSIPNVNNKPPQLVDPGFHADIRFDPNDAAPIYVGLNTLNGQSTTNINWKIYKFTYSGSSVTRVQLAYGAWDSRVFLF